jgi:hypothetical protein
MTDVTIRKTTTAATINGRSRATGTAAVTTSGMAAPSRYATRSPPS